MVKPHSTLPGYTVPGHTTAEPPPIGTDAHEEWLIDVSVEQTFPASDPPATMRPDNMTSKH